METLVLNASYEPLYRTTFEKAINLIFDGKAEVVEEYEDAWLRSVNFTIKMPSVVRLIQYVRAKRRGVRLNRANVYQRDQGRCQYCELRVLMKDFTYDHVIPRSQGGQTTWENVVVCCVPCNQKKGGRTPAQAKMRLKKAPIHPTNLFAGNSNILMFNFTYEKGMPISWKKFLRDVAYWNVELEK